jgi:hypothetical protein
MRVTPYMALIEHDTGNIERWIARFKDSSNPHLLRHAQSLALARAGQLERARTLGREAIDATEALGRRETAAMYELAAAVWEALSGNQSTAKGRAAKALSMSNARDVSYATGFALALAGEITSGAQLHRRQNLVTNIIGRLQPGVSMESARAQLAAWDSNQSAVTIDRRTTSIELLARRGTIPQPLEAIALFTPLFLAFGLAC